jgi:hypothetical protein
VRRSSLTVSAMYRPRIRPVLERDREQPRYKHPALVIALRAETTPGMGCSPPTDARYTTSLTWSCLRYD